MLGRPFTRVTIVPSPDTENLGDCDAKPPESLEPVWNCGNNEIDWPIRKTVEEELFISLAGLAAEQELMGIDQSGGANEDLGFARALARANYADHEEAAEKYFDWALIHVRRILGRFPTIHQLEAVAVALLERETLPRGDVEAIMNAAKSRAIWERLGPQFTSSANPDTENRGSTDRKH